MDELAISTWVGLVYDAAVHAVFIGFTLSMIFAHAPVILPAVVHRALPYHSVLYVPVSAVHLGLIVRIVSDTQNFVPGVFSGHWTTENQPSVGSKNKNAENVTSFRMPSAGGRNMKARRNSPAESP